MSALLAMSGGTNEAASQAAAILFGAHFRRGG